MHRARNMTRVPWGRATDTLGPITRKIPVHPDTRFVADPCLAPNAPKMAGTVRGHTSASHLAQVSPRLGLGATPRPTSWRSAPSARTTHRSEVFVELQRRRQAPVEIYDCDDTQRSNVCQSRSATNPRQAESCPLERGFSVRHRSVAWDGSVAACTRAIHEGGRRRWLRPAGKPHIWGVERVATTHRRWGAPQKRLSGRRGKAGRVGIMRHVGGCGTRATARSGASVTGEAGAGSRELIGPRELVRSDARRPSERLALVTIPSFVGDDLGG